MLEQPSFFIALSFITFVIAVYVCKRRSIWEALNHAIAIRLSPLEAAKNQYNKLQPSWDAANTKINNLQQDVDDMHKLYQKKFQTTKTELERREKEWINHRTEEVQKFHAFTQENTKKVALEKIISEFIDESNQRI